MKNKKVNLEKFYTPNEIVGLGVMNANTKDSQKQMLLRFIREKRIKVVNVGGDSSPRYLVQGKDLSEYFKAQLNPKEYITKGKVLNKKA